MFSRLEMWGQWLQSDPIHFFAYILILAVAVLVSLILHEVAHGYVALRCGDPTAKNLGRLSLNPARHLDPFGTICLFLLGFGWAKPVPVNPRNFRNYRRDDFLVSIAGITVNLTLFIFSFALLAGMRSLVWKQEAFRFLAADMLVTMDPIEMMLYSPELKELVEMLVRNPAMMYIQSFLVTFGFMNLGLGVFNLLPFPPLDGYHIVNDVLLKGRLYLNRKTFQICQAVLIVLCLTGMLSSLLQTVTGALSESVIHLFLSISNLFA